MTRTILVMVAVVLVGAQSLRAAPAGRAPSAPTRASATAPDLGSLLTAAQDTSSAKGLLHWVVLITVLALAPAIIVLVTCFTRIIVVLGLLRQALATQSLPPNQILFGLALLMSIVVMYPVYNDVNREALSPYMSGKMNSDKALAAGEKHIRAFMIRQIEGGKNTDDVYLFLRDDQAAKKDLTWGDVPTVSLMPAFVVSELKIAFLLGFQIYLPFLIIDMLVSSVLISMGMLMLPPVLVSLPFKLLLFVLANGWHLVVGTLMRSFG